MTRAVLFCGGLTFLAAATVVHVVAGAPSPLALGFAVSGLVFCAAGALLRRV